MILAASVTLVLGNMRRAQAEISTHDSNSIFFLSNGQQSRRVTVLTVQKNIPERSYKKINHDRCLQSSNDLKRSFKVLQAVLVSFSGFHPS